MYNQKGFVMGWALIGVGTVIVIASVAAYHYVSHLGGFLS